MVKGRDEVIGVPLREPPRCAHQRRFPLLQFGFVQSRRPWVAKIILTVIDIIILRVVLGIGTDYCTSRQREGLIEALFAVWSVFLVGCKFIYLRTVLYLHHQLSSYSNSTSDMALSAALDTTAATTHVLMLVAIIAQAAQPGAPVLPSFAHFLSPCCHPHFWTATLRFAALLKSMGICCPDIVKTPPTSILCLWRFSLLTPRLASGRVDRTQNSRPILTAGRAIRSARSSSPTPRHAPELPSYSCPFLLPCTTLKTNHQTSRQPTTGNPMRCFSATSSHEIAKSNFATSPNRHRISPSSRPHPLLAPGGIRRVISGALSRRQPVRPAPHVAAPWLLPLRGPRNGGPSPVPQSRPLQNGGRSLCPDDVAVSATPFGLVSVIGTCWSENQLCSVSLWSWNKP